MSIWERLGLTKKRATEEVPQKDLNMIIYASNEIMLVSIESDLKKYGNVKATNNLEEYFRTLDSFNPDLALIYLPRNIKTAENLKKMIREIKKKNEKNIVIVCEQHQLASKVIDIGADYFFMTDVNPEFNDFLVGQGMKPRNALDVEYLKKLMKKIITSSAFTQDEKQMIVEKEEFYESVRNIFDIRSTQTAKISEEMKFLENIFGKFSRKKILDVGCGKGRLTLPLAVDGFDMTGIDITESYIKDAINMKEVYSNHNKISGNLNYRIMNAFRMDFPNNSFDTAILMWHVICDMSNNDKIFNEIHRIIDNTGIVVLDFPNKYANIQIKSDGTYVDAGAGIIKYRGMVPEIDEMLKMLEHKGFQIIEHHRVNWGIDKFVVIARKM